MRAGEPLFAVEGRVYWADSDAAGIAHFTSFLKYCERAEEEYIFNVMGDPGGGIPGIVFPRVHVECDYRVPLRVHDRFRVEIVGVEPGRTSIRWRFKIVNLTLQDVSAECSIVSVAVDSRTGRPVPLPEGLRRALTGE